MTNEDIDRTVREHLVESIKQIGFYGVTGKFEEEVIRAAMEYTGGNKNQAAQLLNIQRTTLVMRCKKYGIKGIDGGNPPGKRKPCRR